MLYFAFEKWNKNESRLLQTISATPRKQRLAWRYIDIVKLAVDNILNENNTDTNDITIHSDKIAEIDHESATDTFMFLMPYKTHSSNDDEQKHDCLTTLISSRMPFCNLKAIQQRDTEEEMSDQQRQEYSYLCYNVLGGITKMTDLADCDDEMFKPVNIQDWYPNTTPTKGELSPTYARYTH